jgi:hypothetical protein
LTVAVTPSSLLSLRSMRFAHDAQVMPGDRQVDVLGGRGGHISRPPG